MTSFDSRYYPHIMDRIFDYTPTATLPVLRRVCRQWRQRFDAEFYHLRDFAAWRHDVKTVQREGSLTLTCQHYRFATKDRTVETLSPWWIDWLPHCQVVDLCNDRFDFKSRDCILVDTLRVPYPHTSCQTEMPTLSCFDCRRVVFDNNFRIETTRDIEKLVINYRGKDFLPYALGISAGRSFKVSEVVFIAHSTEDNSAGQTVEECGAQKRSLHTLTISRLAPRRVQSLAAGCSLGIRCTRSATLVANVKPQPRLSHYRRVPCDHRREGLRD